MNHQLQVFLATVGYTVFGLIVFLIAYWFMVKMSPFSVRKEIEEDQNIALAILMASVVVGIAMIISAVIRG
jgi:uncharacterized membrane protein YjfL (UPF0719 family)